MQQSALIIEVHEADPMIDRWRRDYDPIAAHGIPPHITVLYPFVAPSAITEADAMRVREVVREVPPWKYELTAVREFPDVVWLQPEPPDPFRSLTAQLWAAFPEHPPFGGAFDEVVPHLTVAHFPDGDRSSLIERIAESIEPSLPISCEATELALYVSNLERKAWQCTHRFPFGTRGAFSAAPDEP